MQLSELPSFAIYLVWLIGIIENFGKWGDIRELLTNEINGYISSLSVKLFNYFILSLS